MPSVAAIRPTDIFTPAEWQGLTRVSKVRGLWLIVHAWGGIALVIAATVWIGRTTGHWWVVVPALFLIGGRQLGLAILMHDAAHGLLHPARRTNNFAGEWLSGVAVGSDLYAYRAYHLTHHRYTQQDEDPDLALSRPFPTSSRSMARKVFRDLTGQTFVKQRFGQIVHAVRAIGQPGGIRATRAVRWFWGAQAVLLALSLVVAGWLPFLLWFAALATTFQLALRIRNIAEHACTATGPGDPFSHARTTAANAVERALVAPYWVNYHAEHHLFMGVPCYHLADAHTLLLDKGYGPRMTVSPGYRDVLRTVTAA